MCEHRSFSFLLFSGPTPPIAGQVMGNDTYYSFTTKASKITKGTKDLQTRPIKATNSLFLHIL